MKKSVSEKKLEIGTRIREIRKGLRLSMDELAERIGSTSATISNLENGLSMPGGELLLRMANSLGVSADWILLGRQAATEPDGSWKEDDTRLIFFNEKWHFFCRFREKYMSSEDAQQLEMLIALIELGSTSTKQDLELLVSLARRVNRPHDQ